jgi:hypothetical protein
MRLIQSLRLAAAATVLCSVAISHAQPTRGDQQIRRPEMQLPVSRDAILREVPLEKLEFDLPVLRAAEFRKLFADNPDVPKNDAALLATARKIFSPAGRQEMDECAEYEYGIVFAGMTNPDVSDETRKQVEDLIAGPNADQRVKRGDMTGIRGGGLTRGDGGDDVFELFASLTGGTLLQGTPAGTKPALNRSRIVGRFRFLYTDNNANPSQNTTVANIDATATVLNNAYTDFTTNFREPSHYLRWVFPLSFHKTIDVECYDLGSGLLGVTSSFWNSMSLCSNKVLRNNLNRQTTPVHELFHRVQYAYGYVSGTAGMPWMVEATASWSQKYRAPHVGDWMSRMNQGLNSPQNALMSRSYDACHWWVYLGQRAGNERNFVRDLWARYSVNGKNSTEAVEHVIKNRFGSSNSTNHLVNSWNWANFYKDLASNSFGYSNLTYAENKTTLTHGSTVYGPLSQVPRTTTALNVGTNYSTTNSVTKYGARYYVFNVGSTVRRVEIKVTGTSNNFGYAVADIKNGQGTTYTRQYGGVKDQVYNKTYAADQVSQIAVMVSGIPNGGSFTVTAKGFAN